MKKTLVLICLTCCALSALSLTEDTKNNKPPSSMAPASLFDNTTKDPTTTTIAPNITTTKPSTTSKPSTTTKPTTTKPVTTSKPSTTTKPTTTKPSTTTKPTTTKPVTTTTIAPNTTTTKPTTTKPVTTTTIAPNTTTTKPTTTKPVTTTTIAPNTTTTKPTTTQPPSPTPPTNVTVGDYNLTKDNAICLMASMALQIRLVSKEANGMFNILPSKTKVSGFCSTTTSNLTLKFIEGNITFLFNKSVADNSAYVNALSFYLLYPFSTGKNGNTYTASNTSLHLFPAKIGNSYSCSNESIFMGNGLYLDVSNNQMQGFDISNNDFGSADPCPADTKDYSVAIAVGVTLLVLIIIVVVVYLLSRRRRTTGYQSL